MVTPGSVERGVGNILRRITAFGWDRPIAAGGLLALLLALAAWGAAGLRIDFSSSRFYVGNQGPELQAFHDRWGPDDDVVLVVVEARGEDLLTQTRLEAIGRIADALRALPDVRAVTSAADQRVVLPGSTFDDAVPLWELPPFDETGPLSREAMLSRLPYVPLLLSADGRYAAIVVRLGFSADDTDRVVPAVDRIADLVEAFEERDGLDIGIAGVPVFRAAFIDLTVRDQIVLVPASLTLIGLALFWVFRRAGGVLIPAAAALVPLMLLLGVLGWAGEPIDLLNQAYFTLIPVLAVSDAVHLLSRYYEEQSAHEPREALLRAVQHAGLACTLTTTTTAIAFASLAIGGMPLLQRFGLYAALGMLLAYASVFLILPLFGRLSPAPPPGRLAPPRWPHVISNLGVRHRTAILLAAIAAAVVAGSAGARVTVDNRLGSLLDPGHPIRQTGRLVERSLGGILSLEVELEGPAEAFLQPDIVGATAAFEDWLREQIGVRAVIGPGRSLESLAVATDTLMASPAAIRGVYERLATLIDPADIVRDDYRRARVSVRVAEPGGRAFERFAAEVEAEAFAAFDPFGVRPNVTGTTLVAYRGVNQLGGALRTSLLAVFGVVAMHFLLLFRSPRIALVAMLPNALPLVVGYGAIGLLGRDLDPLSGVVLTFALGIAVDDTIHLLVRVRERVRAGDELPAAIHTAIEHSGRAVVITSVIISGGLAINALSSFPPLQLLGILGATVMLTALACDLLLLPALLVIFRADHALRT